MSSRWREAGGRALGLILDLGCRVRYQVVVNGMENFTRSPSTLVVFNHRRDADTPIIANALFGRWRLLSRSSLPAFIAREDLFRRGFLSDYLVAWPSPVRWLLRPLSLRPFLWALHAHPMRRIDERTLGEVLEDVLRIFGDMPLDQVLKPDWVEKFEGLHRSGNRPIRLSQALESRFQPLLSSGHGLTRLNRSCFGALEPLERATIESQLLFFVELLERGEILHLAPEGAVSRDGRFARIRAGLHFLLNRPRTLVRVLPVAITYDFMTCGRQRVFVNVGREMTDLRGLPSSVVSSRVAEAILAQSAITASQLASQRLLAVRSCGGGIITRAELLDHVATEAKRWAASGFWVDPRLLTRESLETRVAEYAEYCLRSGELMSRGADGYWVPRTSGRVAASWANPRGAINYVNNELTAVARILGRA